MYSQHVYPWFISSLDHLGPFARSTRDLALAYDMDGAFNDLCLDLTPGTMPQPVLEEVDRLVEALQKAEAIFS